MTSYLASSYKFSAVVVVFYMVLAGSVLLTVWPLSVQLLLALALLTDCRRIILLHGLRNQKRSIAAITKDCDRWQYKLLSGKQYRAKLITSKSYRSSLFLVFYLRGMTHARYLIIPRDSVSKRNYRFLAKHLN